MTWSVVAREPETGRFGVIVTTKALSVGARCPNAASGVGALCTQSYTNATFGPRGLRLLAQGVPAADVLRLLIASDEGRDIRQLHLVDAQGRTAAHTGAACVDWCGHRTGDGFSVAGNMLAGRAVVDDTFETYARRTDLALPDRLFMAIEAGQAAGGDKRGRQSAALLVYSTEDYPDISLRVDDHPDPLVELRRIYGIYCRDSLPVWSLNPTRANPSGIYDMAEIQRLYAERDRLNAQKDHVQKGDVQKS
jgi:uncharacterized Ntn-hydrolase superfamily protein